MELGGLVARGSRWRGWSRVWLRCVGGGVVFVFPGQGSQWEGMAVGLLDASPVFAEWIGACGEALSRFVDWSLEDVLRGVDGAPGLDRVDVVQPVLFAVMVSLAGLWRACGVRRMWWWVIRRGRSRLRVWLVGCRWRTRRGWWRCVVVRCRGLAGRGGMVSVALSCGGAEGSFGRWDGAVVGGGGEWSVVGGGFW